MRVRPWVIGATFLASGCAAHAAFKLDPLPADLASGRQDAAALQTCLKRLDGGQRQAIAFAYWQGLTHSELAVTLQVPIGTVKTWIRRGLEKMRRCLDGFAA